MTTRMAWPGHAEMKAQIAQLTAEVERLRSVQAGFQIRFDGPPGPEGGRFVECETLDGKGFNAGRWVEDGEHWLLVVGAP